MIKLGQKVKFNPMDGSHFIGCSTITEIVEGKVVYINEPHRWFSVAYGHDNQCRTSFLFTDIGDKVHVC